jgi:chromosome segregation and condensation protein ScpB
LLPTRAGRDRADSRLGSDSALDTLLERTLIERNAHQPFVTTLGFLDYAGLRDLADLPPLSDGK